MDVNVCTPIIRQCQTVIPDQSKKIFKAYMYYIYMYIYFLSFIILG